MRAGSDGPSEWIRPRLASFLEARGFHLDEDVGAEQYRLRCYGSPSTAMRGYEFYRIACAHVPVR